MPIGTFIPFDETELSPRFFARPISFDCECPQCGRLLIVGDRRRDNHDYDRVTGVLHCRRDSRGTVGCGRKFLIGIVAWNIGGGPSTRRPHDQRPNPRQMAELRQAARGVWPTKGKRRGEPVNTIQPDIEMPEGEDSGE